jgi:hypothetical protein
MNWTSNFKTLFKINVARSTLFNVGMLDHVVIVYSLGVIQISYIPDVFIMCYVKRGEKIQGGSFNTYFVEWRESYAVLVQLVGQYYFKCEGESADRS